MHAKTDTGRRTAMSASTAHETPSPKFMLLAFLKRPGRTKPARPSGGRAT
jgi:hypothetical protein